MDRRNLEGVRVVVGLLVLGYVWIAASSTPFTLEADIVIAIPLLIALTVFIRSVYTSRSISHGQMAHQSCDDKLSDPATTDVESPVANTASISSVLPWVLVISIAISWELFCYFNLPRSSHPTVSSMYDALARIRVAKAVVVIAWLVLGAWILGWQGPRVRTRSGK